jgi:predicted ATPase/class 3 adenylate cyclase
VTEPLPRQLAAVMFTDMVGYTALIAADERRAVDRRDAYMSAVDRHHVAFGGTVVQRLGDGTMSRFPSSLAAVQAAVQIQRELAEQDIPVRIGIHVGEVIVEPERLTGEAVNVASRIESFAVPGGVMLSDAARDQLTNHAEIPLVSLGQFRLKNLGRPVELFAVSDSGIVVPDAAILEGKGERFAGLPSNLPDPPGAVLGRSADLAALVDLVRASPVVTLTGPGGVGKTRMAVELCRQVSSEFLDGVTFIDLSEVTDPADVLPAVAEALEVKESGARTLSAGVVSLIGAKKALLLLDNLEQVVAAATEIAGLVASCPRLRIVTTSRTPLQITAEREYPLAPLALPPAGEDVSPDALMGYPAIALFVDRARTSKPSFALTAQNAAAVADVCRRLDGLPLALGLAAARLRLLSPEALRDRLDHALNVLTTGPRDTPLRHQTLRATIDWSHSLLDEGEQRLFRRMAVFAGGARFEDVEAVCADPGASCLDELESLVDKGLVQPDPQGDRLRMLQTIGEFAREKLDESGEAGQVTQRFAGRYAAIAQEVRDGIEGVDQVGSIRRALDEDANLMAALDTLLEQARSGDPAATLAGLQLCGDLWMYWHIRGRNVTASQYSRAFLDADTAGQPTRARSGALISAGLGLWAMGHLPEADALWAEACRVAEQVAAAREMCISASSRTFVLIATGDDTAERVSAEALERSRVLGAPWVLGFALTVHGLVSAVSGDAQAAEAQYREAMRIQEDIGDHEGGGMSLGFLASLYAARGERTRALELYRRALAGYETIGDRAEEARMHDEMAWTYLANDDIAQARDHFVASVQAYTDLASVRGVGLCLIGLAATVSAEDRPEVALQIIAAAEVHAQGEGIAFTYADHAPSREFVERARAAVPTEQAARAADVGRTLTLAQALDLARIPDTAGTPAR